MTLFFFYTEYWILAKNFSDFWFFLCRILTISQNIQNILIFLCENSFIDYWRKG